MQQPYKMESVRFSNVEFSTDRVALFSQQNELLSVPKKDVRKITLKYGFQSERPLVQAAFGIVLIAVGLFLFANFLYQMLINKAIFATQLLSLLLLPLGIWFILDGLRKRLYFEVSLKNDQRKFPLGKAPDLTELRTFIRMASQLGYNIDPGALDETVQNGAKPTL